MATKKSKALVVAELRDRVSRQARKMAVAVDRFKRSAKLKGVDERWRRFNKTVGKTQKRVLGLTKRLGLAGVAAAAIGGGAGIKHLVDLSARLNQLGIDAGKNGGELKKFKEDIKREIEETAVAMNISSDEIIAGVEAIVQKTGDIDFATSNIENLATAISATGGGGANFGQIFAELNKSGIKGPKAVLEAIDTLVGQGQKGSFVLRDLAAQSERLFAAYQPKNIDDIREMGAALQIFKDSTGSPEQAVTSFERFLGLLKDESALKRLQDGGVKVLDPEFASQGIVKALPIGQVMRNIATATGGDEVKLSALIPEIMARRGLANFMGEFAKTGKFSRLEMLEALAGDGSAVRADALDNQREVKAQLTGAGELAKQKSGQVVSAGLRRRNRATGRYQSSSSGPLILDTVAQVNAAIPDVAGMRAESVDVGGKIVIEINQSGLGSVKSIQSNDPRVTIETKQQRLGPRMPPE